MSSSARSEGPREAAALPDLERDLPTTARDVEVLRALREARSGSPTFPDGSDFPGAAVALRRRGTSAGWEEFRL